MKIAKLIRSARNLANEIRETGIPENMEEGELAWMLEALAEYCQAFMRDPQYSEQRHENHHLT